MRILITGGSGYIGGRLAQFLSSDNQFEVIIGTRDAAAISHLPGNITIAEIKWNSLAELKKITTGTGAIIHLAGMNAIDSGADPAAAMDLKKDTTGSLLTAAISQGVKHFVYFSTAHVYANPLAGYINEKTLPAPSIHPYAKAHLAAEELVLAADAQGLMRGTVIRLSNAFGQPTQKEARCWMLLVNDLCRQAVTGHHMVLKSTGLQRRDFVTLTDACRAVKHLLQIEPDKKEKPIFNVGGNWSPTIWEMACLIKERCSETLGFTPTLERVEPSINEEPGELDYRIDRLLQTGFKLTSDITGEIDKLLIFCKTSFEIP